MSRVLLVDDDDLSRSTVQAMLSRMGHEVEAVGDGRAALQLCRAEPPALVITDLIMPATDGLELIQEIRKFAPSLPIIAISGGGRVNANEYLTVAQKFGAAVVLAKPFSNLELREAVSSALATGG